MTSPAVTHCLAFLTPFLLTHCSLADPSFLQQASGGGGWGAEGRGCVAQEAASWALSGEREEPSCFLLLCRADQEVDFLEVRVDFVSIHP